MRRGNLGYAQRAEQRAAQHAEHRAKVPAKVRAKERHVESVPHEPAVNTVNRFPPVNSPRGGTNSNCLLALGR